MKANRAIVTLKCDDPFNRDWRPNQPESATLSRRDVHTILVKWMGWEPIDVASFWLVCAKLARRHHGGPEGFRRHYLVRTNRRTYRVEGAYSGGDAAGIVCKAERCARSAIQSVKPTPPSAVSSEGHPRPAIVGGADAPAPVKPTPRKLNP